MLQIKMLTKEERNSKNSVDFKENESTRHGKDSKYNLNSTQKSK